MTATAEPCHLVALGADVTACGITHPWDRALNYTSARRLVTCARCQATNTVATSSERTES